MPIADAVNGVLGTITATWNWLGSWNFNGTPFAAVLIGFAVLSILIDRIF